MRLRLFVLSAVLVGAVPLGAAPTEPSWPAHTTLERSSPAHGDVLDEAPSTIRLEFGGPVEAAGAVLTLLGPRGSVWSLVAERSDDIRVVTGAVPAVGPGAFRLEWRVISADGHAVAGDLVFFVGPGGNTLTAPPPTAAGVEATGGDPGGGRHAVDASLWMLLVRGGANLALLALAGLLSLSSWGAPPASAYTLRTARVLAVAAAAFVATYAWVWSGQVFGSSAALGARVDGLLRLTSGRALALEVCAAALASWALLLARRPGLASIFGLVAVGAGGWAGHPAAYTPLVTAPSAVLHLVSAALWTGGLLLLVTERGSPTYEAFAHRVSKVALGAATLVALTGLTETWMLLGAVPSPTGSLYEQLALAKLAGWTGLIAFGVYHRTRLIPAMGTGTGATALSRSVRWELGLAAAVVTVAAVLSHVPPLS